MLSDILVFTWTKNLNWANHIKLNRKTRNFRLDQLGQLLKSKNLLLNTKLLIYKQLIRPIMTSNDENGI